MVDIRVLLIDHVQVALKDDRRRTLMALGCRLADHHIAGVVDFVR